MSSPEQIMQKGQSKREALARIKELSEQRDVLFDELRVWVDVEAQGIDPETVDTFLNDPKAWPRYYLNRCTRDNGVVDRERIRLLQEAQWENRKLDESELPQLPHPWYRYTMRDGFLPGYFNAVRLKDGTVVPLTPPVKMAMTKS
jgi:hypothetical protein